MRKLVLIFCLTIFLQNGYSQGSMHKLSFKLDSLQQVKTNLSDSLNSLNEKIEELENKIAEIEFNELKKDKTVLLLKSDADLFESDNIISEKIAKISKGSEVILLEIIANHFIRVEYQGMEGFIPKWEFENEEMLEQLIEKQRTIEEKEKVSNRAKIDSLISNIEKDKKWIKTLTGNLREAPSNNSEVTIRLKQGDQVFVQEQQDSWLKVKHIVDSSLRNRLSNPDDISSVYQDAWVHSSIISDDKVRKISSTERRRISFVQDNPQISEQFKESILNGRIKIGMSKSMIRAIKGYPSDINRTVTSHSVNEQWVYEYGNISSRIYVYFEDGIVTSYQD